MNLETPADVMRWFDTPRPPVWFVGETCVQVLGMESVVPQARYLSVTDCLDGQSERIFVPGPLDRRALSGDSLLRFLLQHPAARARLSGSGGRALFLFFTEETERLCQDLGLPIAFPPARLRRTLDDKLVGLRIGEEVGVASAPYTIGAVPDEATLWRLAAERGLGPKLVVQAPHGDSGTTTWFVASSEDYQRCAEALRAEPALRIMRHLSCRSAAMEGCVTRSGTVVGPLMTDLTGVAELTPWKGGWCGNEVGPGIFTDAQQVEAREGTRRIGDALRRRGYWGYFEVDWLVERGTGRLFLGEINPRISGATLLSNLATRSVSLLQLHLLAHEGADTGLDIPSIQEELEGTETFSLLIVKNLGPDGALEQSPRSGVWSLSQGGRVGAPNPDARRLAGEDEALWLQTLPPGAWCRHGEVLGRLVLRGRVQDKDGGLTPRAQAWIQLLRRHQRVVLEA